LEALEATVDALVLTPRTKEPQTRTAQAEQSSGEDAEKARISLKDVVGAIVSLSAIATAVFYVIGRYFAVGYFKEMNIPLYQLKFSIWEYGEVAWYPIAEYLIGVLAYAALAAVLFGLVVTLVRKLVLRRSTDRPRERSRQPGLIHKTLESARDSMFFGSMAALLFVIVLVIAFAGHRAEERGSQVGRAEVLIAQHLTLVTSQPLGIPGGLTVKTSDGRVLHRYEDLYMLTYNDDRYFVYRTLGVDPCRPQDVFVVESERVTQATLSDRPNHAPTCP
jgi:hypothetical protein